MHVSMIPVGAYQANCCIAQKNNSALVVDPGAEPEKILRAVQGLSVEMIVLTHRHTDHIGATQALQEATGAPVVIGKDDVRAAMDITSVMHEGFSRKQAERIIIPKPDRELVDGDTLHVGDMTFKVIATPGHSAGGICLYGEGVLFAGDTLFKGSMGRTDFESGNEEALFTSLAHLAQLPDKTVVFSGHGPQTTIGHEKKTNQFLRFAMNHFA